MLTHRHLLEQDVVTLRDGCTGVIVRDPRPRELVQVAITRGDGEVQLVGMPYVDIVSVAERAWLDPIIDILALSDNQKALLKLYWELRERLLSATTCALFIKSTPAVAREELAGLVARGMFEQRIRYEASTVLVAAWHPTKFGGAVLQRLVEKTASIATSVSN